MSASLKPYNTFGLDVKADAVIEVNDFAVFSMAFDRIQKSGRPFVVLGQGSDVLFKENFKGTVLVNRLRGFEVNEDADYYFVKAQAGEYFHDLVKLTLERGMPGLENLALIPGTVGAAPVQNIGAYGVSLSDFCRYVEVLDLSNNKLDRIWARDCNFGYRSSIFRTPENQKRYIITAVEFALPKAWHPKTDYAAFNGHTFNNANEIFDFVVSLRKNKLPDPKEFGNAGSFFKNPTVSTEVYEKISERFENVPHYPVVDDENKVKLAAAWLIDKSGCRGLKLGNAGTYDKQALVLINYGGATPDELIKAARHVQDSVLETFDIKLEPEVRIYGENGECPL